MAVLDRIPVTRVSLEAREIRFGPTIATLLAAALFSIGWVAAKACAVLWAGLTWSFVAVRLGWQQGMGGKSVTPGEGGSG
ncbi:hypothetical protein [Streptomyces sp. NPDC012888]|uniref:hypothetical protein n=1 Tax=Streptomyces sp. NPDC012888 TaxID=3364855 RepID=UPI00368A9479